MLERKAILKLDFNSTLDQSYRLQVGEGEIVLIRRDRGQNQELGVAPFSVSVGEWFDLGWSSISGVIVVSTGRTEILRVEDPQPLPYGGLTLSMAGDGGVLFDELVVCIEEQLSKTLPGQPVTEENKGLPAYQNPAWIRTGGPIGGLGYDIRYNFSDHNIWYVTDAWAGIHMSKDRGLTWFPNNEGITARKGVDGLPIFSATVDPHNPNIIWIGTQTTGGIFKSINGGYSWVKKANGVDENLMPLTFRGFTVDPLTSDIVYAMAEIGSPGWTSGGDQIKGLEQDLTMGIVYKTIDGGENWAEIWRGENLARYCWIDPRNPNVLYISTGIFDREAANTDVAAGFAGGVGILKSTDGGESWRVLNEKNGLIDLYVSSLYMHPKDPDVLLAAASENNWSYYDGRATAGVFLTEDGGESWERVIRGETVKGKGFGELFSAVEYCDSDPDVAYAASNHAIYRSADAGHTWQSFTRGEGIWGPVGIIPGFPIDMQCDPGDPMRIFINNYLGGNFLSEDGGQTWVTASQGYSGAQVRSVTVDPKQPWIIFAGSRTGIFKNNRGGDGEWIGLSQILRGEKNALELNEISKVAVDPGDSSHILVGIGFTPYIVSSQDDGHSWELVLVSQKPTMMGVTNISFAPSDPSTVYLSLTPYSCVEKALLDFDPSECNKEGAGVYVSRDSGKSWMLAGEEQEMNRGILTLAVHPHEPQTVIAALYPAGIYKTTDGGKTWVENHSGLSRAAVRAIAYDPVNPDFVFAGVVEGGIYRSTDGGNTWSHSSAGMDANAYITSIVVDPVRTQNIYAADLLSGVYFSSDGGTNWVHINEGLDHRSINDLSISSDGSVVYAGVEGAGVYRLGTPSGEPSKGELVEGQISNGEPEDALPDGREENGGINLPCLGGLLPLLIIGIFWFPKKNSRRDIDDTAGGTGVAGGHRG
jgi:photosystem II stability/assembly factor-like uncharacterized protein